MESNLCSFIVSIIPLRSLLRYSLIFFVEKLRWWWLNSTTVLYYIAKLYLSYYSRDKYCRNKISQILSIITSSSKFRLHIVTTNVGNSSTLCLVCRLSRAAVVRVCVIERFESYEMFYLHCLSSLLSFPHLSSPPLCHLSYSSFSTLNTINHQCLPLDSNSVPSLGSFHSTGLSPHSDDYSRVHYFKQRINDADCDKQNILLQHKYQFPSVRDFNLRTLGWSYPIIYHLFRSTIQVFSILHGLCDIVSLMFRPSNRCGLNLFADY